MSTNVRCERTYPKYAFKYTYKVWDGGRVIGYVGHDDGEPWRAKVPGIGGELLRSFPTRGDAVVALTHIADGHPASSVGGFFIGPPIPEYGRGRLGSSR